MPALCGTLSVPEDRQAPGGRTIDLFLARVPALAPAPAPDPLFILVGGPGQAATTAGAPVARLLEKVRRHRDIVLVDRRGTGRSHPLRCQEEAPSLAEALSARFDPAELERCLAELDADPTHYLTPSAADDLEDVRKALGYQQINLWGVSYGTRLALIYLRRHGTHVRRMVLDGVAPPSIKLPLYAARDGQRAFDRLAERCLADDACRKAFPDPRGDLLGLLARARERPILARLSHPRTGRAETVTLGPSAIVTAVRGMLYHRRLATLIPLVLRRAAAGDYGPLAAAGTLFSGSVEEGIADGLFLSVICSEDVARIAPEEVASAVAGTFAGDLLVRSTMEACALWPTTAMPDAYYEPVESDVPVLILSGALDPVTPPVWGEEVARHLSRSRHLVAPGAAHGVTTAGCAAQTVAAFIEGASPEAVDPHCVTELSPPPPFTTFAGPPP